MPNFLRLATGSTFKEITRGVFRKLDFVLPPRELVERFEGEVTPLHHLRRALERRNRTLREARDLLLPKLLSGELSVDRVALP